MTPNFYPKNTKDKNKVLDYSSHFLKKRIEILDKYTRSNQDTCLVHKPAVSIGDWVQSGDLLADSSSSMNGELAIGKNIIVAYMPWEGYNYEDAILINERLVYDDVYTSIHIERYEIEIKEGQLGSDKITREIPDIMPESIAHLDANGIAKVGSWIEAGDILVGKVTPINKKSQTPYQKLLFKLLDKSLNTVRDSSLRAPKGIKANVINVHILEGIKELTPKPLSQKNKVKSVGVKKADTKGSTKPKASGVQQGLPALKVLKNKVLTPSLTALKKWIPKLSDKTLGLTTHLKMFGGTNIPFAQGHVCARNTKLSKPQDYFVLTNQRALNVQQAIPLPSVRAINKANVKNKTKAETLLNGFSIANKTPTPYINTAYTGFKRKTFTSKPKLLPSQTTPNGFEKALTNKQTLAHNNPIKRLQSSSKGLTKSRSPQAFKLTPTLVHIYLAEKRKIQVGDKMAGRHGNKGIISNILPRENMPFLPDGTPVDIVLNPLGVPSRMNVGQIYECLLGLAGKYLGEHYKISPFDEIYGSEASRSFVFAKLFEARKKTGVEWLFDPNSPGKMRIFDGRTSEGFDQPVTIGIAYMLKLVHMVDDKIHARSTGPYSLVTQQPLRGRAKQGGQRLGEMEVWAIEGYGAAFVLLEMLTLKSDDMTGRLTLWSNIILNKDITIGTPESFKVLVCELQALCLDIGLFRVSNIHLDSKSNSQVINNTSPQGTQELISQALDSKKAKPEVRSKKKSVLLQEISNLMLLP